MLSRPTAARCVELLHLFTLNQHRNITPIPKAGVAEGIKKTKSVMKDMIDWSIDTEIQVCVLGYMSC